MMKIKPNIGVPIRVTFVVMGIGIAIVPLVLGMSGAAAIALPVIGIATILAGLSGI